MSIPELTSTDLQSILKFTVDLAHTAGALILEGSEAIQSASASEIAEKKNSVDLVTEYDVRCVLRTSLEEHLSHWSQSRRACEEGDWTEVSRI